MIVEIGSVGGISGEARVAQDRLIKNVGKLLWVLDREIVFCVHCIGFGVYFDYICHLLGGSSDSEQISFYGDNANRISFVAAAITRGQFVTFPLYKNCY